jgi:hypothetical protein
MPFRQLGGRFWRAGHCHDRQGHTSDVMCGPLPARGCTVHQARAHHCLPPSEQRDGGTRAQEDQNCLACVWCRPGVAVSPTLGAVGATCRA